MRCIPLSLAVMLIAMNVATAGDYEEGIEAYDRADYSSAFQHLKKSAEQGNKYAQALVAFMYADGQGVPIDLVSAHLWYNLSAAQGYENAAKNRLQIENSMTPEQIAEAERRSREWKSPN